MRHVTGSPNNRQSVFKKACVVAGGVFWPNPVSEEKVKNVLTMSKEQHLKTEKILRDELEIQNKCEKALSYHIKPMNMG